MLGCAAKLAECPAPSDLHKVDFYDSEHIVNLTLDAHLLNMWEVYYETSDLVRFFEQKEEQGTVMSPYVMSPYVYIRLVLIPRNQ